MMPTIALSDIHGEFDLLCRMRDLLDDRFKKYNVVLLGDYIDRGLKSKEVIEACFDGPGGFFRNSKSVVTLRGNHEMMFIDAIRTGNWPVFLGNGGINTLCSLLDVDEKVLFERYIDRIGLYRYESTAMLVTHPVINQALELFDKCLDIYTNGNYLFVHAGVDPLYDIEMQIKDPTSAPTFHWIRRPFLSATGPFGKYKVIHGHTPWKFDMWREESRHRINVDAGATYTKTIAAVAIYDLNDHDAFEMIKVQK